jgi:hypothetical protein
MGAMKSLKLAQMELVEENAERIVEACLVADKGKACVKVVSLLKKCGFASSSPNVNSCVTSNLNAIQRVFSKVATAHNQGMKTSWDGKSFERVGRAVDETETFLSMIGFTTDLKYLSRLK